LTTKPGTSAQDRLLADRLREGDGGGDGLRGGLLALDDLDQRHDRGGVEVVEADDLLRTQRGFADLRDRQRGGVGSEDRVPRRGGVELGEHGLLDLHPLGHGLDDEVDVAERRIGGRALDPPEDLGDLLLGLLGGDLALLGEFVDLSGRHVAGLVEPRLHERVVDVLQHHRNPRGGDRLGDLAAHRPCTDNCCSEHEHCFSVTPSG
jgi:hypothetical protein